MCPKYHEGQEVWLKEFDNGEGTPEAFQSRELAEVCGATLAPWGWSYIVRVDTSTDNPMDDGLREVSEDQIEGPVEE